MTSKMILVLACLSAMAPLACAVTATNSPPNGTLAQKQQACDATRDSCLGGFTGYTGLILVINLKLVLSVAFAALLGLVASITGTVLNIILNYIVALVNLVLSLLGNLITALLFLIQVLIAYTNCLLTLNGLTGISIDILASLKVIVGNVYTGCLTFAP